jgi:pyruvate carboxylase
VQGGERYGNCSGDLKNLLLGKYGPFPFYSPPDWIYEKAFGPEWKKVLEEKGGMEAIEDIDLDKERKNLADKLGYEPTEQQLVTYLQHPNDAVNFFRFEEKFGKVYVLPPSIFFRRGGFCLGETITFKDHNGKEHIIEMGPMQESEDGSETNVYLNIDHHQRHFVFENEVAEAGEAKAVKLSKKEIEDLAKAGDVRAPFAANICEISVQEGQKVKAGEKLVVLEAMKMQTPVNSEMDGVVARIVAKVGDAMQPGEELVKIVPAT